MINKRNYLIKMSLKRKLISKWFLGINIVLFLLILISFNIDTIITFFGGDFKDNKTVLVIDNVGIYDDFKDDFLRIAEFAVTKYDIQLSNTSSESLQEKVKNNKNIIGIEILNDKDNYFKTNIYTIGGLSLINKSIISSSLNNIKRNLALNTYNITKENLDSIEKDVSIESVILAEKGVNEDKNISSAIAVIIFIIPCFFLIVTLVQLIGAEINEEKTTKSMEIIVSNVSAKDHLISKITSCTIFTFIQLFLLLTFIVISSIFHTKSVGVLSASSTQGFTDAIIKNFVTDNMIIVIKDIIPILFISFVITIITYELLAGILASMTTNIDDFQQLQTPLMLIISLGFYLSLLAATFEGSIFIKIMSFIPLISFMLAPTLYMLGQLSLFSVLISTIIQLLFLIIVYKYGIKIYRVGILNYSGEHLWRKIIRALKN